jgi:hypothetical protein
MEATTSLEAGLANAETVTPRSLLAVRPSVLCLVRIGRFEYGRQRINGTPLTHVVSGGRRFRGVTKHRRSGRWEAHIWVKASGCVT